MLKITPKSHTDHSILTYEEWKIPQARLEDYKNDGTSEFLGYVLEDGTIAIADRDYKEHKWKDIDGNIYDSYFPLETTEPTYRKTSYEINTPMVEERILEILSKDKEMYEKSAVIGKFESIVNDFAKEILSESQEETQSHTRRKR
ncbi:hypothetical protein LS74_009285 [Helicobacter magdeburgensis]|uniref:Uncharacterized protein n=1 Tax=Helicobacter magdeburgensis TaxID=471858 RepID=A0A4U8SWH9_9HELI|nr:hypothetical protein [Helicobacter magdeburgensis]TLD91294.1 hypothetical protein LS74_009285 [Helicobacter magdeburgensis]